MEEPLDEGIVLKPKKPRSQAQIDAFKKAQEVRLANAKAKEEAVAKIKEEIKTLTEDVNKINIDIASMPKVEVVDVDSVKSSLKKIEDDIESWHKIIASNTAFIEDKQKNNIHDFAFHRIQKKIS